MTFSVIRVICCITALTILTPPVIAQTPSAPPQSAPAGTRYTVQELDQMLAPIALYPDQLLAQILMAATYPLEIVEADRWLQLPDHAALKGDPLAAALSQQTWDPSVKALIPFPQILHMMDDNLSWTEQLGDAFLSNQTAVMDSVQRLRRKAKVAGNLRSTPQEIISSRDSTIIIEQASPDIVYVPVYDPGIVYGMWPYLDFPPYYFPGFFTGVTIGSFGFGWFAYDIYPPFWGWCNWDWGHHLININVTRFVFINAHHHGFISPVWHHDPAHRRGVPYRDAATRALFLGGAVTPQAQRSIRGYPAAAAPPALPQTRPGPEVPAGGVLPVRPEAARPETQVRPETQIHREVQVRPETQIRPETVRPEVVRPEVVRPEVVRPEVIRPEVIRPEVIRPEVQVRPQAEIRPAPQMRPEPQFRPEPQLRAAPPARPAVRTEAPPVFIPAQPYRAPTPPAFESFGRGADIRMESGRGQASRQSMEGSGGRQQSAPAPGRRDH
ncbi:MAG TPA: DUF3300 domain-containing protein [Gallionella sp.]|nr:DUF3300 domain-containing protein [Gallionella sp.]